MMESNEKKPSLRLLVLITTQKLADKATDFLKKNPVPLQYRFGAEGTASSEIADMLGLGSIDKCVIATAMPHNAARNMLKKFGTELKLHTVNSGVAFTMPLSGANSLMFRILAENEDNTEIQCKKDEKVMTDNKYSLIAAVVNRGFSGDVMDAVRSVGAKGGTVIKSNRIGDGEAANFWGLSTQEEKEIVLIISKSDAKLSLMKCISESCGMHSEAKGVVFSLPVDAVEGFGVTQSE